MEKFVFNIINRRGENFHRMRWLSGIENPAFKLPAIKSPSAAPKAMSTSTPSLHVTFEKYQSKLNFVFAGNQREKQELRLLVILTDLEKQRELERRDCAYEIDSGRWGV